MKKAIAIIACLLAGLLILTGCSCKHSWIDATCTEAATCELCGLTEGEPSGHREVTMESIYDFVALTEDICTECEFCGELLSSEVQPLTLLHDGGLFLCDREAFMERYQAVAEELGYRVVSEESGQEHEKILRLYPSDADGSSFDSFRFAFYNEHFPDAENGKFHILFVYQDGTEPGSNVLSFLSNVLVGMGVCDPTLIEDAMAAMDSSDFTDVIISQMLPPLLMGESVVHNGIRYTLDSEVMCFIIEVVG